MAKKSKSKRAPRQTAIARAKSKPKLPKLHEHHQKKILSLHPEILDAVHDLLKTHGVDAKIHRISFVPTTNLDANALGTDDCPCGGLPCCDVDGVWTCCGD
jgi:hypothetical protein